jgi:hydroxyacylglutathione hydrolase
MFLETVETPGLAHLSYLVGDQRAGVCAAIDPRIDAEVYLELAAKHQARITHVLETHIHADFVSGAVEIASRSGAALCVGEHGSYGFEHTPLRDGDILRVGEVELRVIHTPGHTPEHVCLLASGGRGAEEPWGIFTGDTLFAGEVGRPDLLGEATARGLAAQLFRSLHDRLLPLGDHIEVYPAHGAGSPCGASIGDRKTSTLGYERLHNPRLQIQHEERFIDALLASAPPAPFYYARMKRINAAEPWSRRPQIALQPLEPDRFRKELETPDTLVVDTREIEAWGGAHLAGSLNIPLRAAFPIWAGWLLRPEQRLLLVLGDPADAASAQAHLRRVGLDGAIGYLRQGMRAWVETGLPFETASQMSVHELKQRIETDSDGLQLLDVRSDAEWREGRIPSARHVFAPFLPQRLGGLDRDRPIAVYCGSGFRASMAASLLRRHGFANVHNVPGSMSAWRAAGYPLEEDGG